MLENPVNSSAKRKHFERCPVCLMLVVKEEIKSHISGHQIPESGPNVANLPVFGDPYYLNCTVCGVQVARKRLAKHMLKAHQQLMPTHQPSKYPIQKITPPRSQNTRAIIKIQQPSRRGDNSLKASNNQETLAANEPRKTVGVTKKPVVASNPSKSTTRAKSTQVSLTKSKHKPKYGTVSEPNRPRVTMSVYRNMVGDWQDVDTSSRRGVTAKNKDNPAETLAEKMEKALGKDLRECPICKKSVPGETFRSHMANANRGKQKKAKAKKELLQSSTKNHNPTGRYRRDEHEPDGSKHLGHLRRESSGQFGSYPLHDDHGDESDAN